MLSSELGLNGSGRLGLLCGVVNGRATQCLRDGCWSWEILILDWRDHWERATLVQGVLF